MLVQFVQNVLAVWFNAAFSFWVVAENNVSIGVPHIPQNFAVAFSGALHLGQTDTFISVDSFAGNISFVVSAPHLLQNFARSGSS